MNTTGLIAPTAELMADLRVAVEEENYRAYRLLVDKIDWRLSDDVDVVDEGIGLMIGYGDMKRAKAVTEMAHQRFPEHKQIARTWDGIFNFRPVRVVKSRRRPMLEEMEATAKWFDQHALEYELGHWLAVYYGQLVAEAPTLDGLLQKVSEQEEQQGEEIPALLHQVIA